MIKFVYFEMKDLFAGHAVVTLTQSVGVGCWTFEGQVFSS